MASRAGLDMRHPVRKQSNNLKNERDEDAATNISYTCHICSIDVLGSFSEEHNASKKHRAHATIVTAASERMRALVTARPAPRARSAGKYCGVCNSIVGNGHEKTAKHKQAVIDDQLLSMLASMYCGEDNQDDTDEDEDEEDRYDSDAKEEVNDQEGVNVEEEIKHQDGSKKDQNHGRNVDNAKADDQTELASHDEKIEKRKQNEDDGYFVNDKDSSGASARFRKQTELNRERVRNVEEKIKDRQEYSSQKYYSNGSPVDNAKGENQAELASNKVKIENKKQIDDDHIVNDEIDSEEDEDYRDSSGLRRVLKEVALRGERARFGDEQTATASNFEQRIESDDDGEVDEDSEEDEARYNKGNSKFSKDSHSSNTAPTNNFGWFYTVQPRQPSTVAYKFGHTQTLRAENRNDNSQINKNTQNSVDISQIDERTELKNTKKNSNGIKRAVTNIEERDIVNSSKTHQRTESDEDKTQASGAGNNLDSNDRRSSDYEFFWALVKRFEMEKPWRSKYINISPAGNRIQISVNNEKLNVSYDNFHSFSIEKERIVCRVCTVCFDKEREDSHIASEHHMNKIMVPVNDGHCLRRISHHSHCILCNEILPSYFEEQHKDFKKHCDSKRGAKPPREIKLSHRPPYNTKPYDP